MQLYRSIIRYLAFPLLGRLYNPHFSAFYRLWQRSQYWDRDNLQEHRWRRLQSLLSHAARTVPFYIKYFHRSGLTLNDFKNFDDLVKLPILRKEDYQQHGLEQFLSKNASRRHLLRESTSGTSGRPFAFYIDSLLVASKMARLLRENLWAGWEPGERYVRLWGLHEESIAKKIFYDGLMRRVVISAFNLEQDFDHVEALLRKLRPRIIEAYTSAAVHLASLCRDRKKRIPSPESIIVSAETLTPKHRALIENTLGGRVYNRYGSREFGNIAHECERGGFHINAESFHVEEVDHSKIPGAKDLVITLFDNYAMPFLRYRIGDMGRLSSESCTCGRQLPLLKGIDGRTTDFFILPSDRLISFLFFNYFFEQYGGLLDQYQIEQLSRDFFEVRILPGPLYKEEVRREIHWKLQKQWRNSPRLEVKVVKELVRGPSGKLRTYMPLVSGSKGKS